MRSNVFLSILAVAVLTSAIVSCQKGPKPENTAEEFLNAYLSNDYAKAASFCTLSLSGKLLEAVEEIEHLQQDMKDRIANTTKHLTLKIDNVEKQGNGDTLLVSYSIHKPAPDSTLRQGIVQSVLSLVKEEENWKVAALNKL